MEQISLLNSVYAGWAGYHSSLIAAVSPLTPEQWEYRPVPSLTTVSEVVRHIADGRLTWFARMNAPGVEALAQLVSWETDDDGNRHVVSDRAPAQGVEMVDWLRRTGDMVAETLRAWTEADLRRTYRHVFQGTAYAVSYQWTVWRILSHDNHHGGQLTLLLRAQGIDPEELSLLGGHLDEPPPWLWPAR